MLARIRQVASKTFTFPVRCYSTPPPDISDVIDIIDPYTSPQVNKVKNTLEAKTPGPLPRIPIPPAEDPLLHYITSTIMRNGHRHRAERDEPKVQEQRVHGTHAPVT